ncbi:PQQ-dependent sugar dehydrogenase [Alcanivorax sediminis]|uniref:PQQ-dependent sugar dehydrogenase n=1 Tax=Alcanivorax sediminis TaxID=2663008 RepID=A0A6N7LPL0_9GAMM|nr:PQQ-dependent sugar dehydrogenase [Alcanivorax sediminis]MQX51822.1 PQQ-dependent sugar dehydrogenase [Alcanivorax sediminis]
MRPVLATLLGSLTLTACADHSASLQPSTDNTITASEISSGLHHPWSLAFVTDKEWLVTERRGTLRRLVDGKLQGPPISGVPEVAAVGQGGLLDMALHPDFANNQRLYLSYSKPCGEDGGTTAVGYGLYQQGSLNDFRDVYVAEKSCTRTAKHFGGRILFDDAGHLFLTIGDRGQRERAQDTSDPAGSVLRLHDDGRIPQDNPLTDQAGKAAEIWSWGHRNPQGLALHPQTGKPWLNEHGPRGGDEINAIEPGINYGWPVITYGREYYGPSIGDTEKKGYAQPLLHWTPSIAPSGMAFITSNRYPGWEGDAVNGALKLAHLNKVTFNGLTPTGEVRLLLEREERIRDVRQGPDGYLYLLTDSSNGKLLRLEPAQ